MEIVFYFVHLSVVHIRKSWNFRNLFPPSTMWVPGNEFTLPSLVAGAFIHSLSRLTGP